MADLATQHPAITGCLAACEQCLALIDHLSPDQYRQATQQNHPIGDHMRHCVDHFLCFFRGMDAGLIDYDARERDPRLESDSEYCREVLTEMHRRLRALDALDPRTQLLIQTAPAPGASPSPVPSCLERELLFLSSHTIHHIAIMMLLAARIGVELPSDFGVAYSTAAYRSQLASRG